MLLHIRPRLYCPFRNVALIDLEIEPLGIHLRGGVDLRVGRPYPNKWYSVACRKLGRKAMDGILIETPGPVNEFSCRARWAIQAELMVTHSVEYRVIDHDFDAASDSMILWSACCAELGGWSNRRPERRERDVPLVSEPVMEVVAGRVDVRRAAKDVIRGGWIVERNESFAMPTIERERILQTKLRERIPGPGMVLQVG
jgi:hypothetical protein